MEIFVAGGILQRDALCMFVCVCFFTVPMAKWF